MGTTQRVLSGSKTRGTKARIVYPDEYSGSNTLDAQLEGVYVTSMNHLYGSTVVKIRPNNDFLKIIDGKVYKGELRAFDDAESPSSFVFADSETTSSLPTMIGTNHPQFLLQRSQIALRDHGSGKDKENKGSGWKVAPNHFRDDRDLGQTDIFQNDEPFKDTANMDPLNIVTVDPLVLDVPINMVNQSDNNLMDGAIEPFPLRSIIDRSHLEVPFQRRGIRADMTLTDVFRRSETISFEMPIMKRRLIGKYTPGGDGFTVIRGTDPYLDGVEVFGLEHLSNRQKIIDAGITTNYPPAVTGSKGAFFSGSIRAQKEMWSQHKSLDMFMSTGSSSGPIAMPGYLMKPDASVRPFEDTTDLEKVTSLVTDENIASPGNYGDLDFPFNIFGQKYVAPPVTQSHYYGSDRRKDLVYHARFNVDGLDDDSPSLRSGTELLVTESLPSDLDHPHGIQTYISTGSFVTYKISASDTPFSSDLGVFSLIGVKRSSAPGGIYAAPGVSVIDSKRVDGRYNPSIGVTIPGILSASDPNDGSITLSADSSKRPAYSTLAMINNRSGGSTVHNTVLGGTLPTKITKTDVPCRPFAAGVWIKGDALKISSEAYIYIEIHNCSRSLKYSGNQVRHPSKLSAGSRGGYTGDGTQYKLNAFINVRSSYGYVYTYAYNYCDAGKITGFVYGYSYFSPTQNSELWNAFTDEKWHHIMYGWHGSHGRSVAIRTADFYTDLAGHTLADEYGSSGGTQYISLGTTNTNSDSKLGAQNTDSADAAGRINGPLSRLWVDGKELDVLSYASYNYENGTQCYRAPTTISDTLDTSSGPTSSTNTETIHKFGFPLDSYAQTSLSDVILPMAEPHIYVTPVHHSHMSGSADAFNNSDIEDWYNNNIWTGKVAKSIYSLSKIENLGSVEGEILKNALKEMNVQHPGHSSLSIDHVSLGRGFVYDNTEYGFDSLVFGGLKK